MAAMAPALVIFLANLAVSLLASLISYMRRRGDREDAREEEELRRQQQELEAEAAELYSPEQFAAAALLRRRAAKCAKEISALQRRRREASEAPSSSWWGMVWIFGKGAPAVALWTARLAIVIAAYIASQRHEELIVVPAATLGPLARILTLAGIRLVRGPIGDDDHTSSFGDATVSPPLFSLLCSSAATHLVSSLLPDAPSTPQPFGELAAAARQILAS